MVRQEGSLLTKCCGRERGEQDLGAEQGAGMAPSTVIWNKSKPLQVEMGIQLLVDSAVQV